MSQGSDFLQVPQQNNLVPGLENIKVLFIYANSPMDNLMPVSISSLAGALRRAGIDCRLFDTTYYPATKWTTGGKERKGSLEVAEFDYSEVGIKFKTTDVFEDLRKEVLDYQPNLIALSTVESTYILGIKLLEYVRDLGVPTVVGGVFAIFSPDHVFQEPSVDFVCVGEGEEALVELCQKMASGEDFTNVKNIWGKHDGKVFKNEKSQLVELDQLPRLDFTPFDKKRIYRPMSGKLYRMVPIEFSRGCAYKCTYCSAPMFEMAFKEQGDWLRNKSIDNIRKEMEYYIREFDVEYFYFVSETFLAITDKRLLEFCDMYRKIGLPFWANTRPETVKEESIKMLEDIGCHRISIGVEAGNEEYRRKMLKRPVSNERVIRACEILSKSSIEMSVNNIIGFPGETREMIFDTIRLNREIDADSYGCSIFQPYRGTELFSYCVEQGYWDPSKLSIDLTVDSPLTQPHISSEEIRGLHRTFPLYIKFSEAEFKTIRRAETFDTEGDGLYDELSRVFREKYEKRVFYHNPKFEPTLSVVPEACEDQN